LEIPQANPHHSNHLRDYWWVYQLLDSSDLHGEQYFFATDSAGGRRIVREFGGIGFAGGD
jgi:hypothetical protein